MQFQMNSYKDYVMDYASEYIGGLFKEGIIKEVEAEKLKKMFSSPDQFQEELASIAEYFYISNGEVRQLFELVEVLPQLNHRIDSFDKRASADKHLKVISKALHRVKHKTLTRDLMKQNATVGNVIGIWLGDKSSPYPFVFDNMKYVFPIGRNYKGEWLCVVDLSWFDMMSDLERKLYFTNLSPFVTDNDYENYRKNSKDHQYKELPYERTFCLRTGTTKRNQAIGTNWATSGLLDVLHKKKLKDVEQSVANKIINAVAVLTIGSDKNPEKSNDKIPKPIKQKIHLGVKSALEKNHNGGVSVVTIPETAKLEFPKLDTDGLDGNKFDQINSDIKTSYGMSGAMTNGEGANFATAKLNLEIFYKRLGVMLESIESEVYQRLFNLILPDKESDNYYIVYDKEMPLTLKEKIDYLSKLNDKGWSSKHFIEAIGMDFDVFLQQTLHETDDLLLQEKLKTYNTSHTQTSNSDNNGRHTTDDNSIENENTQKSKASDGNSSK
ncbi:hypothetical protein [Lysinibacillus sp. NPDC086135]|uniref:hypothetical protein n=1 Tax=Lysinibacillus sp. NPDC086135 TaxID=3364130 RepID=UPI003829C271